MRYLKKSAYFFYMCFLFVWLAACAGGPTIYGGRGAFYRGEYNDAYSYITKAKDFDSRHRLLHLFEAGAAAQAAGLYRESKIHFNEAYEIIRSLETINPNDLILNLTVAANLSAYVPLPYERILLHSLNSLNYLMTDEPAGARVEMRRALEALDAYEKHFFTDEFTRLLASFIFYTTRDYDNAYIEMSKVYNLNKEKYSFLETPLKELEYLTRRSSQMPPTLSPESNKGRLIVMILKNRAPRKKTFWLFFDPEGRKISLPSYEKHPRLNLPIGVYAGEEKINPILALDLFDASKKISNKDNLKEAAKEITRYAARRRAERELEDRYGKGAASTLKYAMMFTETADLRIWETLPAFYYIDVLYMEEGVHNIKVNGENHEVFVRAHRNTFLPIRVLN